MKQLTTLLVILLLVVVVDTSVNAQTPERCAELLNVDIELIYQLNAVQENGCFVWVTPAELPACPSEQCMINAVDQAVVTIQPSDYFCNPATVVAEYRDRAGESSVTCQNDEGFYELFMQARGYIWEIWTQDDDPLPLAVALGGAGESARTVPVPTIPDTALVSPAPSEPPSVDLSACSGLSAEDDARCIASRAVEEDELDLCAAAIDAYACSVAVMETIDNPCADADDALTCMIEFATDTGLEAACETLPADAQGTCFAFAAATSGDLSLVERRFPPGDERDTVYATLAVSRKDPTIIEEIEDNYTYDGARVLLMLPMVLETGEAPPEDYCETLRGNYDRDFGDYPEDATLHYDSCGRLIVIARQLSTMNEDEQASFLIDQLRATGNPEDAALADQMEAAFEALEDE